MLISRFYIADSKNSKKKRNNSENFLSKTFLIILVMSVICFYLFFKSINITNFSKFEVVNKFFVNNGFTIKNIEIEGANNLDKKDILKIIHTYDNINIFSVNVKKIYEEIKKNTCVKEGSIEIIYPDKIKILLIEKKPVAIWQNKYGNNLITKNGDIISDDKLNNFNNNLPIIIGHNAHKNIYSILKKLDIDKNFIKNIWSLTFVNERRWDIHFNQGLTIRLPSNKVREAWKNVLFLHQKFNILNLGLTEIDLRNSNKIIAKINIDKNLIFKNKRS